MDTETFTGKSAKQKSSQKINLSNSDSNSKIINRDRKNRAFEIAAVSLLLALAVASAFLPTVRTPIVRLGFGFIPIMTAGMMLKVRWTVFIAVAADIIKYFLINSSTGAFNPGITFGAAVAALIWGIAFSPARKDGWEFNKIFILRIVAASFFVVAIANIGINTFALSLQLGKAWIALLFPWRLWSEIVTFALHIPVGIAIAKFFSEFKKRQIF